MNSIEIIAKQLAMQTRLFNNVLDGLDDTQGLTRVTENVNHLRWIAGHLLNIRYRYAQRLGVITEDYPHAALFNDKDAPPPSNRSIDPTLNYPTLEETKHGWNSISAAYIETVSKLNEDQLNMEIPVTLPIGGNTVHDMYAFLALHEMYHIGQMSLIRKELGHSSMSFR